jgi:hypothetical protein
MEGMSIEEAAKWFVEAEIKKTKCMQKHFKQLCQRCREYMGCSVYLERFDAWKALERRINGNKE